MTDPSRLSIRAMEPVQCVLAPECYHKQPDLDAVSVRLVDNTRIVVRLDAPLPEEGNETIVEISATRAYGPRKDRTVRHTMRLRKSTARAVLNSLMLVLGSEIPPWPELRFEDIRSFGAWAMGKQQGVTFFYERKAKKEVIPDEPPPDC